jgi:thiamine biosynthesis lipoprotein
MRLHHYPFKAMGSPCELQLYADSPAAAGAAAEQALAEVRRLEAQYSRYRDDSVTTRINRSAGDPRGVEVDAETAGLLDYAATAWEQSGGLFDLTTGVLRRAWDFKAKRVPTPEEIAEVLPLVGWDKLRWQRPILTVPAGMELDFGGYVKEYAADSAARVCRAAGIRHGLVELGGDIALVGPHPDAAPWQVGVRNPRDPEAAVARIPLRQGAIASSGDYERYFEQGGRRYCHILNPKSGWPAQGLRSVSVIAAQCLVAGTASTVAMLMGPDEGPCWLDSLGLPYLCVDQSGTLKSS